MEEVERCLECGKVLKDKTYAPYCKQCDEKLDKQFDEIEVNILGLNKLRHYSIWIDKYNKNRENLLKDLEGYKKGIESIRKTISDKNLILPLEKSESEIKARMCFVDGGEGIRELLGAAIYLIRASGLILDRTKRGNNEKFVRGLDMNILDYDDYTKERVELLRGAMESDVAARCIEEHDPEYLFMDGSLYVNSRKRPIECDEYPIYRKKFVRLLKLCKKKSVHIIGVSEDSRSRLFVNYLSRKYNIKFPRFMTDSSVLRLLAKNTRYRTVEFTPQSKFEANDKLTSTLTAYFPTVYIQPTELSNPLRVDVPDWEHEFDKIIRLIVQLSKGSKQYGYPIPLYLAHLDARIEQKQADWSITQLIHYMSKNDPDLYDTILRERRRIYRP